MDYKDALVEEVVVNDGDKGISNAPGAARESSGSSRFVTTGEREGGIGCTGMNDEGNREAEAFTHAPLDSVAMRPVHASCRPVQS